MVCVNKTLFLSFFVIKNFLIFLRIYHFDIVKIINLIYN